MRNTKLLLLSTVAMTSVAFSALAQEGDYSDDVNWDLNRTTQRSDLESSGPDVGGMTSPGYNPNVLRPAGDGFGRHEATQDIEMQSNSITGISNIVGNGTSRIVGIASPTDDSEVANKFYVDTMIGDLAEDLEEEIGNVSDGSDDLTGGDGITRTGDSFAVDNTVVRTSGDQNIAGVKNFQTRINVSSNSNRPFDSRSHANGGAGVYGRSTNGTAGIGVVGIADGNSTSAAGVLGSAVGDGGRGGSFEAYGDDGTGIFSLSTGQNSTAAEFVAGPDAETAMRIGVSGSDDEFTRFSIGDSGGGSSLVVGIISERDDGIAISGISTPVNDTDAVNKAYVDDAITGIGPGGSPDQDLSSVLTEGNNAGGTAIVGLPDPTLGSGAATKTYVDNAVSGLAGPQNLDDVLTEGNNAGGARITGLSNPAIGSDAATKDYVDDAISGVSVGGGADNLGNHVATQNLDMSNRRIENIFAAEIVQGSGATMTYGNNLPYADVNVAVIGTPGDPGTSMTTYIDDVDLDSWRVRTHNDGTSDFENALNLVFDQRALYLYGDKVLTTANLSDQQLDFDNDRDGELITSPGGFSLFNYSSAIRSVASGNISSSMTFNATGENSTGILGFASGQDAFGIRGISVGPGVIAGNFSAQGDDGVPFAEAQTGLRATLRSDVAVGSVAGSFVANAPDTTALEVEAGTSAAKIAAFKVGVHEPMSIIPNGTAARLVATNGALGSQTVDLNTFSGGLTLSGNSAGGLFVTQNGNTPKVTLTRTNSNGNSHIRYAGNSAGDSITVGLGNAGRFAVGTGNDLSYASTGSFEVIAATGDVRWKGTATGTVSTPSDERLKENVSDIVNALDKLSQLRPVEYDLKEDGTHNYGVIAQELEAIYPEMVNVNDEGILSVEYQQLISPMLAALLEMDARITALESQ
ncbi:tail fiber domain-containing protein [Pseudosulfitobacter pseudonitzschiae]|uniref:tail fiber domain-containing protein n=1 Tax=Pseudosulfitobacter pseudonitzschiae TaxID=1402135 RepID=UPI003B8292BD